MYTWSQRIELSFDKSITSSGGHVFVVAEIGINHGGDVDHAREMIREAARCGVDAVKFQTFYVDELLSRDVVPPSHVRDIGEFMEMLRRLEFTVEEWREIKKEADAHRLVFFSTVLGDRSLETLLEIGVAMLKVASMDVNNYPLLEKIASTGLPVIMSTGMAYLDEIDRAVRVFAGRNDKLVLLHAVSVYPPAPEEINLSFMNTLRAAFGTIVGYSDHYPGATMSLAAVAMGARVIEKHFTLRRDPSNPDDAVSLEPEEMRSLVEEIRSLEKALGDGARWLSERELANRRAMRRSIVACRDIGEGEVIGIEDICFKRPGTGIPPGDYVYVVGRRARRPIKRDTLIRLDDLY